MAQLVPFPPRERRPAGAPATSARQPDREIRRWQEIVERLRTQGSLRARGSLPPAGIPMR